MARHGSASVRKHESHTGNRNLSSQITQQSRTITQEKGATQQSRITQPGSQVGDDRSRMGDHRSPAGGARDIDYAAAAREYDRMGVPRQSDDIDANLKRRARRLAVNARVDHGTRWLIRSALENRDPCLIQLVTRVEAGELRIDHLILDTD
jgi:hypothetical protein